MLFTSRERTGSIKKVSVVPKNHNDHLRSYNTTKTISNKNNTLCESEFDLDKVNVKVSECKNFSKLKTKNNKADFENVNEEVDQKKLLWYDNDGPEITHNILISDISNSS